jgi:hypothetical protein
MLYETGVVLSKSCDVSGENKYNAIFADFLFEYCSIYNLQFCYNLMHFTCIVPFAFICEHLSCSLPGVFSRFKNA